MKKVLLILLFFFAALSVRSKFSDISHFFPVWSHFSAPVPTIIITQPANSTTCIGTNATFTVVALNATGYQWQVNQGSGYLNIANGGRYSGANTATLNITGATANMSTYTYRCLVMGDIPAASTPATLTVRQAPVITQNPMPNTICEGENVLFYIAATNATAYRWQVNTGSGFTDLSDGPGATGGTYVNTHTAVLYITGATVAMSDYYYRCVVTGACTPGATSAAAAFTVLANETYYEDYDGDGYGNAAVTNISCTAPIGFVSNNQDCDDNNPSLHPGATEICGDGIDNNCNGQIDEGCSAGITNVTSSNANSTYKIDDIIDIQLIFSAAVNVTGSPSLMLNNGGTATYASGDGTSTLTFSYTVVSGQNSSNLDYSSSNALSFNGGSISNVSGGSPAILTLPAPGSAGSLGANKTFIIDATRPTAGIVVANTSLSFGQTSLITITFSEAVIGFTDSDLMVQNGAISMLNSSDGGRTWTARLTPSPSVTDPSNLITLNNSDVTDENGNAGIGTATSNNYAIDNIRPTAGIAVTNTNLTFGTTSTVTITFNEAVTGFTTDDLTVENGVVSDLSSSDGGTTWTALLTPNNSITDATNVITLDNTGVTDLADNTGTGVTNSNNYEVNTNRPTATIVVADNALSIGETPTVTITFSEAVTGFTNDDLTIANGTLSAVNSTDGGITWKATLTPAAEITYLANVITLDNTGVTAVLSGNAGTGVTNSNNYTIDTNRPTATIVVADAALSIGETPTVTITFSEAITGFTNTALTITNGTLSAVSSTDGGITWKATLTPAVGITEPTNLITLDNTGVTDLSGNTGAGNTNSNNYAIDTNRPTATIVIADNVLSIGETPTVTITFSEAVTGFTNDDLTIANGTLSSVSSSDAGITWEATFTPAVGITDLSNVITLDNTGVTDLAGNTGTGITNSNNYAIDTKRPTATIVMADAALSIGETPTVTITFSEAVTGFTNADLTIANGTLSAVNSTDGGITWKATLTPTIGITDLTNVITLDNTGVTAVSSGNAGTGNTSSANYAIDTTRPTATIVVADAALNIGKTPTVTITFSEAITGFTNDDLTIANGTLSPVNSTDGGITWKATLTPAVGITDPTNLITLDNTGVTDLAGNTGTDNTNSNNYAIDTNRPTATIVVADNTLSIGETPTVTITFSEAVIGFTNDDLTVANGTLSAVSSTDGGITWKATLTPATGITEPTNLIILDNTGVTDAAGNAGTGITNSNNYAVNTNRPTATIVVADNALSIGETPTVTITFSEAITGFTNDDLTVANGTLSAVSSTDGGITWKATLTPAAEITYLANVITLDNTGITAVLSGNAGTGVTNSNNYTIDTNRPTATIVVADAVLNIGETPTVTITFSEAITGFTNDDLTIANGMLSPVNSTDGGITWKATLTPAVGITDPTNLITLDNTGVTDLAGNTGTDNTNSNNYAIDTNRPTATIVVADNTLSIGETPTVTITFSEAVIGFTNDDLTIANGTLSAVSSTDGGITWKATLTPATGITDPTNLIILDNTGVTDVAGNAGTGITNSNNYAVNTNRPTATIVVADNALSISETPTVTITFSEAITGFTNDDLTVANGTLSAVSSTDGGITWKATLTPAAEITYLANVITLDNTGITAVLSGNAGTGVTNSNNYTIDTNRPTATIVVADNALSIGETPTVTITFSEAITGFTNTALTITNGTLSAVSSTDGGITWKATLTPAAGITEPTNLITLDNTGVTDLAGNTGIGNTNSNNYAIDTNRPTATIVVADNALSIGETPTVTITFSEAVTGFTNDDLTVANGTLSAVSSTDGGITWKATLTPATEITDPTNLITLDNTGVTDLAGNAGTGITNSNNYAIETNAPNTPTGLAATPGDTEIVLNWTANTETDLTKYRILAGTSAAPTTILTELAAGTTTYRNTGLNNGTTYYYRIQAIDQAGNISTASTDISAVPKANQTITFNAITVKTYGEATFTLGNANSSTGLAVTYTAADPSVVSISGNNATILKAGNTMVTASQTGNTSTNAAQNVQQTLTINKATLTVKPDDKEKFAATANPTLTISYSGFVNNETIAILTSLATASTTATTTSPIGDYPITAIGATAANYDMNYVAGTLRIKPGAPTNISLAGTTLYENSIAGTNAGTLSSTSDDPDATFTYTLVAGTGDTDNALFAIAGNKINTTSPLNFENKASYSIRVKSTTQHNLSLEKVLTIALSNVNEEPTLAAISDQSICFTTAAQTVALTGISAGPDAGQTTALTVSSSNVNLFDALTVTGIGTTGTLNYKVKPGVLAGTATITITVKDNGGTANGGIDTYSRSFVITVNALPVVAVNSDKGTTISKGETVLLTATGGTNYIWANSNGIIGTTNTAVLQIRPSQTTTYTVTATNASGCSQTQTITIVVNEDFAKVKATNILTPNNDGYNDKWFVDNIDFYPNNEVKIFDKTGRLIYNKKGYDNSWDGTFNGVALNEGTYYYVIDFGNRTRVLKGFITIVRND